MVTTALAALPVARFGRSRSQKDFAPVHGEPTQKRKTPAFAGVLGKGRRRRNVWRVPAILPEGCVEAFGDKGKRRGRPGNLAGTCCHRRCP